MQSVIRLPENCGGGCLQIGADKLQMSRSVRVYVGGVYSPQLYASTGIIICAQLHVPAPPLSLLVTNRVSCALFGPPLQIERELVLSAEKGSTKIPLMHEPRTVAGQPRRTVAGLPLLPRSSGSIAPDHPPKQIQAWVRAYVTRYRHRTGVKLKSKARYTTLFTHSLAG